MRRGELWTAATGSGYTGKPRPVLIVQDDAFAATASVTVCPLTTNPAEAPLFRLPVEPSATNGLLAPCRLMVDKVTTVAKSRLGRRIGRLDDATMLQLNRALVVFLGVAS